MASHDKDDMTRRMRAAVDVFKRELSGLRTGRATPTLLDPVTVEAYGSKMPLNQVGTVGAPEPRLLTVTVWDKGLVVAVEKAIRAANLGLNPQVEGTLIRVPLPALTEERRKELGKVAHKYAEQARVAIRNVRRDGMEHLKKQEHDKKITKDQHTRQADETQKLTDTFVKEVDDLLAKKEAEILQV